MSDEPRGTMLDRLLNTVRALDLTNVLIIALIVIIALPAYFSYRFITDADFRHDFMTTAAVLDKHVPCIVFEGTIRGGNTRHTIAVAYGISGRNEKMIGLRSPGKMTDAEIEEACKQVLATAATLKLEIVP